MTARPIATTRSAAGHAHRPAGRLVGARLGNRDLRRPARLLHHAPPRRTPPWPAQAAHTNTWVGAFNTLVLLTSSLSAVLAHQAAERGDGKKAAQLLCATDRRRLHVPGREGASSGPTRSARASRSRRARSGRSTTRPPGCTRCTCIAGVIIMLFVAARRREEPGAAPRRADRDLLALRRRRLDLPVPPALHREVGNDGRLRTRDRTHARQLRQDLGDPAARCSWSASPAR